MEEIIQLPPLAILLNGVVEALNEIRSCAPTNVVQGAAQALRKTLDAVRRPAPPHRTAARRQPKTVLCTQASRRILGCRLEGGDLWGDLCEVYVTALLPHVVSCFEKLFRGEDRIGTWEARGGRLLALEELRAPLREALQETRDAKQQAEQAKALAAAAEAAPEAAPAPAPAAVPAAVEGAPAATTGPEAGSDPAA